MEIKHEPLVAQQVFNQCSLSYLDHQGIVIIYCSTTFYTLTDSSPSCFLP